MLAKQEQWLPALKLYDRIARLGEARACDWYAMGLGLFELGEHAQALGALERSVKLDPGPPESWHRLAWACYRLGDVDRAVKLLDRIKESDPTCSVKASLATIIPGAPGASLGKIRKTRERFAACLAKNIGSVSIQQGKRLQHKNGRLRIAYFSSFFHRANYMKPVWGLINNHERRRCKIYLYDDHNGGINPEGYIAKTGDQIRSTRNLSNEEIAALIAEDGIDVLVDLNAYSVPARLGLFLSPPAPVTVAWFNMYATSALPGFDWIVGDEETLPPGEERYYTEKIERLPLSYLTFDVTHSAPPIVGPPCAEKGYLTFGSLVSQYKMTPLVIDSWAKILRKVGGSRLHLANSTMASIHNQDWLKACFQQRGIGPDRINISGPASHYRYLENYDQIDVALDSWPYNGGTTTMEALWQGVPVLTLEGDRWAARTSRTLLRRTHLADWVVPNRRALVRQAIKLARDPATPETLSRLRHGMRERLQASSVCDTRALAKAMEAFYFRVTVTRHD